MTLNEMIDDGVTFQGKRIVSAMREVPGSFDELVLYEGEDEWFLSTIDDDWAEWDVNFMWADSAGNMVIELENPNI